MNYRQYIKSLNEIANKMVVNNFNGETIDIDQAYINWCNLLDEIAKSKRRKIVFIGNGGSAGIASHCATDFSKNGNVRSMALNDAATITCLSNDYSYDQVFSKQIEFHGFEDDVLVAISSSGNSNNIIQAVKVARTKKMKIITLSGFKKSNSLNKLGDMNFYIDSMEYGFVEILHLTAIHTALDLYLKIK